MDSRARATKSTAESAGRSAGGAAPEPTPLDWLDAATVERVREALATRSVYPDAGAAADTPIELVRTHISAVFLTARHVFKFKRPLDVGFADFHTLALRERYCRAEVTLNRRLAPGVYLDVLPLRLDGRAEDARYVFGNEGAERLPVVDWCVVMERLPGERMLDRRLAAGSVGPAELDALARRLVDFHAHCAAGPELARYGSHAVLNGNWQENFAQSEAFVGEALSRADFDALRAAVADWLARNAALLRARAEGGYVRDGHGDLRCEHIYLGGDGALKIIDCIEFNERFRYGDVANDLAFLLMDLAALGRPELARDLLARYAALSGDAALARLVPFYACYRATVRGKVTAFKLRDADADAAQRARVRERAAGYFRLAADFARQMAPPVLLLVGGLMGTGKTALAEALARRAGVAAFNSDALRKALVAAGGGDAQAGAGADYGAGVYGPAWNARTYDALLERAHAELAAGRSLILDASFSRRAERARAAALAEACGARLLLLECTLDEAATRARLRRRTQAGGSLSDGREALYERQRAAFEPVTELPAEAHRKVRTDAPPEALAEALLPTLALPPPLFGAPPAADGASDAE